MTSTTCMSMCAIQINDTHPTMVIPELIRLLMQRGFNMDTAVDVCEKDLCLHKPHDSGGSTGKMAGILSGEGRAASDADYPGPGRACEEEISMMREYISSIGQDRVHMAHIDIHYGYAVNGVAALHTEILKESELKPFYDIYPEKFNNKTNGITFRRWLVHCNHRLSDYLTGADRTGIYGGRLPIWRSFLHYQGR